MCFLCASVCVCVSVQLLFACVCVCACHSGVWTVTFLCLDNHRALCPSVPPAMTQGNVTCQSQTPTYNRWPLQLPSPPYPQGTSPLPPTVHHPSYCDPNCSSPGPHLGDKSSHRLSLPTPFVFSSTTSYDSISSCSFAALYPNGNPTPSSLLHLPPGLQNIAWEDSAYGEWRTRGWEVDFLPGPRYLLRLFSITLQALGGWRFMHYMGM